ncbi:MAG: hypothetical protein J6Q96_02880 [Bacteroidales bacterium]|nr:hypothetical protein [Bacteroidales bacterium]
MKDFFNSFVISFVITLGFIITTHNLNEANASLDRCEELVQEIKKQGEHLEILKTHYDF